MSMSLTRTTGRTALALAGALTLGGTLAVAPTASAAPNAAPAPCVTSGCRIVAHVDVDGDGRADTVSLTPARRDGAAARVLRVVTAKKTVAQVTYGVPHLSNPTSWYGAARIDGVTGNELVVRVEDGAHTQWFSVYSWRGGKLVAQREPAGGTRTWAVDGAWSVSRGYTVNVSKGTRTLTARYYLRDERDPRRFDGVASTYTWRNGAWRRTGGSAVRVPQTSPKVAAAYGWRVAGLPRG